MMWNESLIESMGGHRNGKRWLTVQLAAIIHAAAVGVLVAASYWYVERVSLPAPDKISAVLFETIPGGSPPPQLGTPQGSRNGPAQNAKPVTVPVPLTQNQIMPEESNENTGHEVEEIASINAEGLPFGSPDGVAGGDPDSKGAGGFGGPGGDGSEGNNLSEGPIVITPSVQQPVLMRKIEPDYPEPLRVMRKEGTVVLEAVISKTGDVQNLVILRAAHPLFDQSAIDAVRQWKYRPAKLNGKPVAVYFKVTVVFRMR